MQPDGVERVLEDARTGQTLMEVAREAGVEGILAECGGCCDCGTCHVYVDKDWYGLVGPPDDIELGTLDLMVENMEEGRSRLSCQIKLRPELDGLKVKVATS